MIQALLRRQSSLILLVVQPGFGLARLYLIPDSVVREATWRTLRARVRVPSRPLSSNLVTRVCAATVTYSGTSDLNCNPSWLVGRNRMLVAVLLGSPKIASMATALRLSSFLSSVGVYGATQKLYLIPAK